MPRFFNKKIDDEIHLLLWHLTESYEELLALTDLNEEDVETFSEISHNHKKIEFLAGRLAIKDLCEISRINFEGIIKDEHGKPFLKNSEYEMSISHTVDYIGVVIRKNLTIGIDIEKPRKQLLKVVPRLFSEKEVNYVESDIQKATLYWSAKEALYKLYGKRKVDFRQNLFLDWNQNELLGSIKMPDHESSHRIISLPLENYLIVIAY